MEWEEFKNQVQKLIVNKRGRAIAPHKAILLLSIIDMIETNCVCTPFIPLSKELERTFISNWRRYVPNKSLFHCSLHYPFYHLSSSPFWKLWKTPNYEPKKEYSATALKRSFYGAIIPETIFEMLKIPDYREEIRNIIRSQYINPPSSQNSNLISPLLLLFASSFIIA